MGSAATTDCGRWTTEERLDILYKLSAIGSRRRQRPPALPIAEGLLERDASDDLAATRLCAAQSSRTTVYPIHVAKPLRESATRVGMRRGSGHGGKRKAEGSAIGWKRI